MSKVMCYEEVVWDLLNPLSLIDFHLRISSAELGEGMDHSELHDAHEEEEIA